MNRVKSFHTRLLASGFCLGCALAGGAVAQPFPAKTVRIVVPLPPGGSNDLLARIAAERLTASLGQPVVVDNRPGGSGNIGTELVARSAPDGHTLLMANTAHVINPSLFAKLPFDPLADFAGVALMSSVHFALVVHPSHARAQREGVHRHRPSEAGRAHVRFGGQRRPPPSRDGNAEIGRGAGQFVPALVAGEVTSVIGAINSLLPHVRAGRLRALAMAGARRTPLLPGVPTIAEAALPGYALDNWGGMLAPAGTPRAVIERLNGEIVKTLRDPQVAKRLTAQGVEVTPSTPEAFDALLREHAAKWARIVKAAHIRLQY